MTWLVGIRALVALTSLASFLVGRSDGGDDAQTMAFVTLALAELLLVFTFRRDRRLRAGAGRNRALEWAVLGSALLVVLVVYVPALRDAAGTEALSPAALLVALALATLPAGAVVAAKRALR